MLSMPIETPNDWREYELVDSGHGAKLEKFAGYTVSRPDPRAIWQPSLPEKNWQEADASYERTSNTSGRWKIRRNPPEPWQIHYDNLTFILKPTEFKHMGIFPEQAVNWRWLQQAINRRPLKILNLFAYTGGATLASALAGAMVTHVDSVKNTVAWARENAGLSRVPGDRIRWITDDAYKFALREARRDNKYDGIILDPPRFGRGPQGEVWKLAENLPKLLALCEKLLSEKAEFIVLNAYTADLSGIVFARLLQDLTKSRSGNITVSELALKPNNDDQLLPNGFSARWRRS